MIETIRTYNTQFRFVPEVQNEHLIRKNYKQIVLCGMGGSHLPAGILKTIQPGIDIYVHKDYDLPPFDRAFLESSLLIASSFSGNTAEAVSFYKKAKQLFDLPVLCISTGGELLALAKENNDPYIELPQTKFVPRTALGLSALALASVLKDKTIFDRLSGLSVDVASLEAQSDEISKKLENAVPVFYSSIANMHLAYNWKIKCNETSKIHAFYNIFPEANHNELEGYDVDTQVGVLPVILHDSADDARVLKRFDVFLQILDEKNIPYVKIDLSHPDVYQKVFRSIILGDLATAKVAAARAVSPAEVPLIESFKKRLI